MDIGFVVNAQPDRVTGPRNSVTNLVSALNSYTEASATVYSPVVSESFSFNDTLVRPLDINALLKHDVVVFSGVWLLSNVRIAKRLRKAGVPYVVSPRSSLMKKQFLTSPHKKLPFMLMGGFRYLTNAHKIHFLTQDERDNSLFNSRSFVMSNIISDEFSFDGQKPRTRKFGFLGRYVLEHKGLDVLFDAVLAAKDELRNHGWVLELHGSDNRSQQATLQRFIDQHGLKDIIELGEPLHGVQKTEFLRSVDVFIHCSRYEGQPQALMEAMAMGCATLITPGTNMAHETLAAGCGVVVNLSAESIAKELKAFMSGDEGTLSMQQRAAAEASVQYGASTVARSFLKELQEI